MSSEFTRRYPVGAEVGNGGVHFRVWAPRRRQVDVVLDSGVVALQAEGNGYFSGLVAHARPGTRYRFQLDDAGAFPDPASRFQPEGPHGPSEVVDPACFAWSDQAWPGVRLEGQVIYEMHIGTFTREGTWEAARREFAELRDAGITVLEVMPVADFAGRFGWGYDGVDLYAPTRLYGAPDDFRRFIDDAHRHGLGVTLDVVYNHIGPDGNYLKQFAEEYFTARYANEWGEALNFDGPDSGPVREFFVSNAAYWMDEYHLDGLRLDATQQIFDSSRDHVLAAIGRAARAAAGARSVILAAENESQEACLARPESQGGYGLDALWNDDFHHSAAVALTGRREAYYTDYRGAPQEFISALKYGYLYQGQWYSWQKQRRGKPAWGLRPAQFVLYLENHDQVANSGRGERLSRRTTPGRWRALHALLLLAPGTPLLFQGEEFASSTPFLFFADHHAELAPRVREGRRQFLSQFPSLASPEMRGLLADPGDPATLERAKLDFGERTRNAPQYAAIKDLLRLRREDPVFRAQARPDGAVLAREAFGLRFFGEAGDTRLMLVNLGRALELGIAPEPLLAPPEDALWELLWSSEDPRYGGDGTQPLDADGPWRIPGHAALVLRPAHVGRAVARPGDLCPR